jgi:low affinity Fe/Cu permease
LPSSLGSNWLGLLFPLLVFLLTQAISGFVNGLQYMKDHWKKNIILGFAVAGAAWTCLFGWCVITTVDADHGELNARVRTLHNARDSVVKISEAKKQEITNAMNELKVQCATKDGTNQTLQNQNRDQQSTINRCFSEAMKLLTPEPLHVSGVAFDNEPLDGTTTRVRWLVITNKTLTPARLNMSCNGDLLTADASIAGSTAMLGRAAMVSTRVVAIDINSPPFSPTSPIIVTMTYRNSPTMGCNFFIR